MKKRLITLLSLIMLSSAFSGIHAETISLKADSSPESLELISAPEDAKIPTEALLLFIEIFDQLKNNYVDPISDTVLIQHAINGMLALDPHSKYYTKEAFAKIQQQTSGTFAGIGIEFIPGKDPSTLLIQRVFNDSPAFDAGLKAGALIEEIDQVSVKSLSSDAYANAFQGEVGSMISLSIRRGEQSFKLSLTRDNVRTPSLSVANLYNNEFAYLRLDRFQLKSDEEIINALLELEIEAKTQQSRIQGVILDLRDNPGGLLSAAISVADLFLSEGLITYTDGQAEQFKVQYHAKKHDIISELPLLVLINAKSASGSEIVAGALQDHQRALIVGENSYGKGSVQIAKPLKNGDAIRYTSSRYYTPKGRSIQNFGITPDVIIANINVALSEKEPHREINNQGHLDNPHDPSKNMRMPANFAYLIEQGDYPLYEALNILRAMSTMQSLRGQMPTTNPAPAHIRDADPADKAD